MKMAEITNEEKAFCDLYIYGGATYAYKPDSCYMTAMVGHSAEEVYEMQKSDYIAMIEYASKGRATLNKPHIKEYIKELLDNSDDDFRAQLTKEMLIDVYSRIIVETSTTMYYDENGNQSVPASARAVAIQAGKALSEIVPVKESEEDSNLRSANITLTVTPIMAKDE